MSHCSQSKTKEEISALNQKLSLHAQQTQNSMITAQEARGALEDLQKRYSDLVSSRDTIAAENATWQVRAQKAADECGMWMN